jgi:streptogramin lyase
MAEFEFESRLRLALREAAERETQRGRFSRSAASGRSALRVTAPWVPAAAAVAATLLALAVAAALLTFGHAERKPVHPPNIVSRLTLSDSLGLAVNVHGSLWTDDRSGNRLLRIDPVTREVVARIPVPDDVSLAGAGDSLWALPTSHPSGPSDFRRSLLRIDARTSRVTARIPVNTPSGEPFSGSVVAADPAGVWAIGLTARMVNSNNTLGLVRIDPRSGRVTRLIAIPRGWGPADLALRGPDLWVITGDDRLLRFDARTGSKLSEVRVGFPPDDPAADPEPGRLGFAGSRLVATARGGLAGIDPATGRVIWRSRVGQGVQAWTSAGGLIWASARTAAADRLFGVNPANGRVVTSVDLGEFGTAGIASVGQDLWVTTAGGKAVILRR